MAATQGPLPPANFQIGRADGRPTLQFLQYLLTLDATVKALAGNFLGSPIQLTNAANDAAAAIAGVAIGQLYRNGSVVQIRVT
jgi:hypothetical protein